MSPGLVGRRRHLPGLGDGVGQRLLARHVLAGGEGGQHVVVVEVGGGEDLDGVDVRVGEQVVELGVGRWHAPSRPPPPRPGPRAGRRRRRPSQRGSSR